MKFNPAWLLWPETRTLIEAFGTVPMRFVGGAVRDSLLGVAVKDVDVATPLLPEEVMQLLARASIKVVPTGISHGTVTAVVNRHSFEITTLRRDVSTDGRRATVAYTDDWREDAARRDFTMNALYCDKNGDITDYFQGQEDALSGYVRFIGDPNERIREDALRILRFFRFLGFYGRKAPDPEAIAACAAHADKIDTLSGERISQEMLKLLSAGKSADIIRLMQTHSILAHAIPQEVSMESLARLPSLLQEINQPKDPLLALALLLRSSTADTVTLADTVCARWKLSRTHCKMVSALCRSELPLVNPDEKSWKKQIRIVGKEVFIKQALLHMAEGAEKNIGFAAITLASHWQAPEFPLTGDDLIRHGIKPGKAMGTLLKQCEHYWEEEDYIPDKEALLAMVINNNFPLPKA